MKKSISTRFSIAVVLVSVFILLLIILINFLFIKNQLTDSINTKAKFEIFKSQNEINHILFKAITSSNNAKNILEKKIQNNKNIASILIKTLKQNQNIYGMAVALEPETTSKKLFCPYYYKKDTDIIYVNLATNNYDYLNQSWYKNTSKNKIATWSEPYYDNGGGETLMATYSNPLFYNKKFIGVVTIDLSLDKLFKIVSSIHILKNGYAFLLSKKNAILVHPDKSLILKQYQNKNIKFNTIIKEKTKWIYYTKIENTDWILGIVLPKKDLFSSLYNITTISVILAIIGIFTLVITIFIVSNKIIEPLKKVIQKSIDISNGNFNEHIKNPKIKDEIYLLSTSINKMQDNLQDYIKNLKKATQKEEKRKIELDIANKIQMDMLKITEDYDKNDKLKIYTTLISAKEVSGDFYDFFYLDKDKLCFVVADVSGKGVPAALFMAVAISYIRAYSSKNLTPAQIIYKVNNSLSLNNQTNMFVTMFFGIIDIEKKQITYVNAGHPKPYIFSSSSKVRKIDTKNDPIVGAMEDMIFNDFYIDIKHDEKIFIFTDGVNEAFSQYEEQFGEERIEKKLKELTNTNPNKILNEMNKSINIFCNSTEQSDDITMMLIHIV